MASGFCPVFTLLKTFSVFKSKTDTSLSPPSLVKPLPRSSAIAIPCTPLVPGMVPTSLSVAVSINLGLRAMRDVQAMVGGVNVGVVPASPAPDLNFVDNFINRRRGQGGARDQHQQEFLHDMHSLGDVPSH